MPFQTRKPLIELYGRAKTLIKKQWKSQNRATRPPKVKLRVSDLYPPTRSQKPTDERTETWKSWLSAKVRRD
jgi:hypothetical protein